MGGRKPVRQIRPILPVGTKICVEWDFGNGESEYINLVATRNGELSLSDLKTPEHFNSPFRSRNKSSMVNFFYFEVAKF